MKLPMTKLRFAPSPTGYLHVGNIRTALINWLFARKMGGEFWLRMDDTDKSRSKDEYEQAIYEDMEWLGLKWDGLEHQSGRVERYAEAIQQLKDAGRLYACYETPDELDIKRKMLQSRGLPPVYDRGALKLTAEEVAAFEAEGRKPHWRFKLEDAEIKWDDLVRGEVKFNPTTMSDPVLVRADGILLYTLASVVDDDDMNITHVVRGEDHVSNTAVQLQIFDAFGFARPIFAHTALLKTKDGELSKRTGGGDIRSLRELGILPMSINAMLAKIGTSDAMEPFTDMQQLVDGFDFKKFGRAPAQFEQEELEKLNEKLLHQLPYDQAKDKLDDSVDETFWNSVRGNIKTFADVKMWHDVICQPVNAEISEEDKAYLVQAAELLPPEPWDEATWDAWIAQVKDATGRKGKQLFMPLRLSLTGMQHGPELKVLLPLLGRTKTLERLA